MTLEANEAHFFKRLLYALGDVRAFDAEVFRTECHVVFHERCDELVVGVLEHHACGGANVVDVFFVLRIVARNTHAALVGHEQGIHVLRERRFAGAVAAQDTNEFAVGDMQIDASQHEALAIVGESNVGAIDHNRVLHKHVWPLHMQRPAWGGGALFGNAAFNLLLLRGDKV